jgi:hypothetical protein
MSANMSDPKALDRVSSKEDRGNSYGGYKPDRESLMEALRDYFQREMIMISLDQEEKNI